MVLELMIPMRREPWNFFERQRSVFSQMHKEMDDEFRKFDHELETMRRSMFKLAPVAMTGEAGRLESLLLKVDRPVITDAQGNKRLALRFDVSEFKPEEISVKTTENRLMVAAKHVEESPCKKVYKEFSRQYVLPNKIDPTKMTSILSADGVLNIEAPAPEALEAPRERLIPIQNL